MSRQSQKTEVVNKINIRIGDIPRKRKRKKRTLKPKGFQHSSSGAFRRRTPMFAPAPMRPVYDGWARENMPTFQGHVSPHKKKERPSAPAPTSAPAPASTSAAPAPQAPAPPSAPATAPAPPSAPAPAPAPVFEEPGVEEFKESGTPPPSPTRSSTTQASYPTFAQAHDAGAQALMKATMLYIRQRQLMKATMFQLRQRQYNLDGAPRRRLYKRQGRAVPLFDRSTITQPYNKGSQFRRIDPYAEIPVDDDLAGGPLD